MKTNRDRLKYLREKIRQLNSQIHDEGLEDEYIAMVNEIADGKIKLEPVSDETWEVMLPKEKEKQLLNYYHSLRTELQEMVGQVRRQGSTARVAKWLENPWVQATISAAAITNVALHVVELVRATGLLFEEEKDTDSLV